jgi:hypothetical protein
MKIIFSFIFGIFLTITVIYLSPFIPKYIPQYKLPTFQLKEEFSHEEEGQKLQNVEMIDHEDYKSTEGNDATLYKLKNQCKLTIIIFGESYQSHISFYFHKNKVLRAFQTELSYLNGGFYAEENTEKAFELQESSLRILNPENQNTTNEFNKLAKYFKPKLIQEC